MYLNSCRLLSVFAVSFLLFGCASPRLPMTTSEVSTAETSELQADEAIILVRLNYLSPSIAGGVLNFHYDGADEIKNAVFVRSPDNWYPMFSIPTLLSGKPLLFKVKAGRLSFTQFNRGMYIGDVNKQLNAYAKARTITYIGEINLRVEPSNAMRFSYGVTEDSGTVEALQTQHPTLFAKYPRETYLLKKDL